MNQSATGASQILVLVTCLLAGVAAGQSQVTFSDPVSYPVGTNPGGIVTADFNGDGIPDLAVANNGDPSVNDLGSVSLLLGKGDGTFQPAVHAPAGAFPTIILAGDFNGDGKLDLFVEGQPSGNSNVVPWSLLFGHGDGTFESPVQFALANFTAAVVVGDFNNDKKLDLAFTDTVSGSLEEVLGNGDGTFQPVQTIGAFSLGPLVAADFNGDGIPDLAMGAAGAIQVLLAKGDGTFTAPTSLTLNGPNIQEVLATDVNRDGKADLIAISLTVSKSCLFCTTFWAYHLEAHLSNGDGSFGPAPDIVTKSSSKSFLHPRQGDAIDAFVLGDFDSDGKLDIGYQQSTFDNQVVTTSLILIGGQGNGTFPADLGTVNGSFTGAPTTADLNGDKLADLGAEPLTSTTIGVILNTTQGFWLGAPSSFGPLRAGGSTTGDISVNPQNGLTNSVSLTCSAPQSAGIQCALSSASVAPGASSVLTVTTTGNSAASRSPAARYREWFYALCLPFAAIFFGRLSFGSTQYAKGRLVRIAIGSFLLLGVLLEIACGSGSSKSGGGGGTPAGSYTITVTGTSGTISRSSTIKLTVQ